MSAYARTGGEGAGEQRFWLPILVGFSTEIVPVLLVLWLALIVLYLTTGGDYWWAILPWATVTVMMLWPVGRSLGRPYLSYRSLLFILGVLSMAYIILNGFVMQSTWPFLAKSIIFWGLIVDLTLFGLLSGLRAGISRPIEMFFRPDLLFGDGRVLCCGTIAMVLGIRYIIGTPAMGGAPWPVPRWNWYAIFIAMIFGFIPLIALRGMLKLLMRLRRIRDDAWTGWGATILREGLLVLTLTAIGYAFHNAFMGWSPFTWGFLLNLPAFWEALGIFLLGALILIFVRGGYKMSVGDPFILETPGQTLVKQLLFVAGAVILYYGLMSLLHIDLTHFKMGEAHLRTLALQEPLRFWIGFIIFVWGLLLLIPGRVLVQHYQRLAIVSQIAAVLVPSFAPVDRRRTMGRVIDALLKLDAKTRTTYLQAMNQGLATASDAARVTTTRTMVEILADLPASDRDRLIEAQLVALSRLDQTSRVTRMADMMGAVAELPEEKRRPLVQKIAILAG